MDMICIFQSWASWWLQATQDTGRTWEVSSNNRRHWKDVGGWEESIFLPWNNLLCLVGASFGDGGREEKGKQEAWCLPPFSLCWRVHGLLPHFPHWLIRYWLNYHFPSFFPHLCFLITLYILIPTTHIYANMFLPLLIWSLSMECGKMENALLSHGLIVTWIR